MPLRGAHVRVSLEPRSLACGMHTALTSVVPGTQLVLSNKWGSTLVAGLGEERNEVPVSQFLSGHLSRLPLSQVPGPSVRE